ncbi:hypothetical protein ACFSJQ_09785 [Vibrio olivae]
MYQIAKAQYDQQLEEYKLDISRRLEDLVVCAQADIGENVLLKLPNKSVARDASFGNLYELFDGRFRDTREEIKKNTSIDFNSVNLLNYCNFLIARLMTIVHTTS